MPLSTAGGLCGICAFITNQQPTCNPNNQKRRHSTADASFQPIIETLLNGLLRANFCKSSEDHLWSSHNTPLQIPRDVDAATYTCCKPVATYITKQQTPAPPSSKHLHHQAVSTCTSNHKHFLS